VCVCVCVCVCPLIAPDTFPSIGSTKKGVAGNVRKSSDYKAPYLRVRACCVQVHRYHHGGMCKSEVDL
jgi:hypothetical protein